MDSKLNIRNKPLGANCSGDLDPVFRGYRCILIAAFGWLALGAAQPEQAARQPADATNENVASALENLATALDSENEPSEHEQPCPDREDNRSSDLCAQWKAADAAQLSANVAWWVAIVGSILGALTLAAAVAAAIFASVAAFETRRSAGIADGIARLEREPVISVQIPRKFKFDGSEFNPRPEFVFTNLGRAHAVVLGIYRQWEVGFPHPEIPDWNDPLIYQDGRWKEQSVLVGGGEPSEIVPPAFKLERPPGDKEFIYAFGFIEYENLYQERWRTRFSLYFDAPSGRFLSTWHSNIRAYRATERIDENHQPLTKQGQPPRRR